MTRADRWMVAGAWALLAFCVGLGALKISDAPKVESWVVEQEQRWEKESRTLHVTMPDLGIPKWNPPSGPVLAGLEPADPWAVFRVPEVKVPPPPPLRDVKIEVLPAARLSVTAGLDGAVIEWTLEDGPMALEANVTRSRSKPVAFVVERGTAAGTDRKAIASLDPKATRHVDLTAEPLGAYRYWVVVVGPEVRLDGRDSVRKVVEARKESEPAAATMPQAHRVSIVGGDLQVAVLRVEKYDRASKTWTPRVVNAKPGEKIGASGWTLDGLRKVPGRFGTQSLVADVTDAAGAKRNLAREE
jgi:hypothetical protein